MGEIKTRPLYLIPPTGGGDATAELYFDGELVDTLTIPSGDTDSFSIDCATQINAVRVDASEIGHQHGGTFKLSGTLNGKDTYVKVDDEDRIIRYDGTRWLLEKIGGGAHQHLAALGDEDFPWEADWTLENLTMQQATVGTYCSNGNICADATVNINNVKLSDVASGGTLNITVVDSNDDSVSVTLSGGNKITIPILPCAPTTCNDAYQLGANFLTLDRNNPFGNTNRFTAIDGSQTYTNGIAIDWLTAKDNARTVMGYGVSIIANANHATQIGNEPYTLGLFGGFTLIRAKSLFRLMDITNPTKALLNFLDYPPFNHIITGTNTTRIRTRENAGSDTAQAFAYIQTGALTPLGKTVNVSTMIEREFTYTELGL
jgi:hypothetical protein